MDQSLRRLRTNPYGGNVPNFTAAFYQSLRRQSMEPYLHRHPYANGVKEQVMAGWAINTPYYWFVCLNLITATICDLFSLLYFCRQLCMFRMLTPIIRSSYNCNYSFWHWSTGSTTIRYRSFSKKKKKKKKRGKKNEKKKKKKRNKKKKKSMKHWWNDTGREKMKYLKKNVSPVPPYPPQI